MWSIENTELRPATLDFRSSEQGWRDVTQLFADGIQIINAIELVEWEEDEAQFLICEECGITNCKRGDWVRIRRSDSLVVVLPSFEYVWPQLEEDTIEFRPPRYLSERGIGYFDRSTYESLNSQHASFPPFEQIPQLNMREAALLFHWDAPAQILGIPPDIRVNSEIVAGVSEGSFITHVKDLLNRHYNDESQATLRPLVDTGKVISIYLDAAKFVDWRPLVVEDETYRLVVDSRFVIVNDEAL